MDDDIKGEKSFRELHLRFLMYRKRFVVLYQSPKPFNLYPYTVTEQEVVFIFIPFYKDENTNLALNKSLFFLLNIFRFFLALLYVLHLTTDYHTTNNYSSTIIFKLKSLLFSIFYVFVTYLPI